MEEWTVESDSTIWLLNISQAASDRGSTYFSALKVIYHPLYGMARHRHSQLKVFKSYLHVCLFTFRPNIQMLMFKHILYSQFYLLIKQNKMIPTLSTIYFNY